MLLLKFAIYLYSLMRAKKPIRIKFIGDVSFNDRYILLLESGQYPFEAVLPLLQDADFVVGNLECGAKGAGENLNKRPRISTTEKALDSLKKLNLGLVTLANNHIYDNLETGFDRSIEKLQQLGIAHIGATRDEQEQLVPHTLEKDGWRVGFLNYVHTDTHPHIPSGVQVYVSYFNVEQIIEDVKKLRQEVDRVVLLLHWGGKTDYGYFPHKEQVEQAKRMIQAGADAIVGCHTHSFQTHDHFDGKPVYYSLGNFCFADIHCDDGGFFAVRESGKKGAVLSLTFTDEKVLSEIEPFYNDALFLKPRTSLKSEFSRWQWAYRFIKVIPLGFSFYYWALNRIEPIFYYSQLHKISIASIALSKLKRLVSFR